MKINKTLQQALTPYKSQKNQTISQEVENNKTQKTQASYVEISTKGEQLSAQKVKDKNNLKTVDHLLDKVSDKFPNQDVHIVKENNKLEVKITNSDKKTTTVGFISSIVSDFVKIIKGLV